eukprot:GHUV01020845.1.p1 GENE.GHUV01020845.1~~GHUV01020845.1.p1  ORF type:complete len:157 (+),score=22.69 GHUV01020845.1:1074-1544(+)
MFVRPYIPHVASSMWSGLRSLSIGSTYSMSRVFTDQDANDFVRLTGDSNPIHVDLSAASAAGYQSPILPGMLMASLFPSIIGSTFPGALYLTQTLKFRKHASVGATVHAEVTVATRSGRRVTFNTVCKDSDSVVLVDGTALALIKELDQMQQLEQQ